jgi:hypothetical protein
VVLGKVTADSAKDKAKILDTLKVAIRSTGQAARCFEPRHCVRITKGSDVVDYVLCFECWRYRIYRNGVPHEAQTEFSMGRSQSEYDAILKENGIPLAPR